MQHTVSAGQASGARHISFYRYVSAAEAYAIETNRIVQSTGDTGLTWYSPDRYHSRSEAKRFLALPVTPTHRVGPYPEDELPPWSTPLEQVEPAFGEPGGGWQAATDKPLYLFEVSPLAEV